MKLLPQFVITLFITACSVSKDKVSGTYLNAHYQDTLHLYENGNYEYAEHLNSGQIGWTEGKWMIHKRSITFLCDHRPLVGYRLKVRPDSLNKDFQIRLTMGDTDEPVFIDKVSVYNGPKAVENSFIISGNVVKIQRNDFDSIVVRTFNFKALKFYRELQPVHGYVAEIYPVDRLYELDKVPFHYRRKRLKSFKTSVYPDIDITFTRTDKQL